MCSVQWSNGSRWHIGILLVFTAQAVNLTVFTYVQVSESWLGHICQAEIT